MLKRLFVALIILLFSSACLAATVGNTSDPKVPYGPGVANMKASGLGPFKVGLDADCIIEKELKDDNASDIKTEGQWYLLKIGCVFSDKVEPYAEIGCSNLQASWKEYNSDIKVKADQGLAVGLGTKILAFEIPEHRIRVTLDGQYRYTEPDVYKIAVDVPDRSVSASEFKVSEWQAGAIVSMEFPLKYDKNDAAAIYSLIPYAGIAYANTNVKANFIYEGLNYNVDKAQNKDKFLLITGCDITSPENISLNVEGRLIGETAASGGCSVKF